MTASRIGLSVRWRDDVFATYNGQGVLTLGVPSSLDADDCVAQMVFHEVCHALVQGEGAFERADWGLDNLSDQHLEREHACLRVQAALLAPFQLREILAPTTEHRAFFDRLPADALKGDVIAQQGYERAFIAPFAPYLKNALEATGEIVRIAARFASPGDLLS